MALTVQQLQKQHLGYLESCQVKDFNNVLDQISSGKVIKSEDDTEVNKAVRALLKMLLDAKSLHLNERDFFGRVKSQTDLNDDKIEILWNFLNKDTSIDELITSDEYRFRDLEWRLEAKVATRFLHSQPPDPKIVFKFHLDREQSLRHRLSLTEADTCESMKELVIEASPNNLVHIIKELESARSTINVTKATRAPKAVS